MIQVSTPVADMDLTSKSGPFAEKAKGPAKNPFLSAYNTLLTFGIDGVASKSEQKYIRLSNLMAINTLIGALVYLSLAVFSSNFYWVNTIMGLGFTCVLTLCLNALGKTALSRQVYVVGFNVFLFLTALFIGPTAQVERFLLLAVIIPFLICDLRETKFVSFSVLLPLSLIYCFGFASPYFASFNLPETQQLLVTKAGMAMQYAVLLTGIYHLLVYTRKTEEEMEASKRLASSQAGELKRYQVETEQLAYAISHDLRAPVRNVTSFMNLLAMKHGAALNPEAKEFIEYSRTGSKRMERLIEDMVTYYRIGTNLPPAAAINMNDLTNRVKFELNNKLKIAKEAVVVNGDLPVINNAHAVLLQQLLQHLVVNGLKFNKSEKPEVSISGTETDGFYSFSVKDNGIGISKEYSTAIYLIFKRLHGETEYDGIGAGLAICKKIVEFYQGTIWFESEVGKGTTFHFTIRK